MSDAKKEYEAPKVKDLKDLSLYGQWPLATDNCTAGTGQAGNQCGPAGTGGSTNLCPVGES
jgi:hypothetical protein